MGYESLRPLAAIMFVFLVVLAILWFFLPFAIFGTKDKLQELIDQNKQLNTKLDKLIELKQPPSI